jgi:hypothetical protein
LPKEDKPQANVIENTEPIKEEENEIVNESVVNDTVYIYYDICTYSKTTYKNTRTGQTAILKLDGFDRERDSIAIYGKRCFTTDSIIWNGQKKEIQIEVNGPKTTSKLVQEINSLINNQK